MNSDKQFHAIQTRVEREFHSYTLTVDQLCRLENISRVTLHRILKKHTGQSATHYINNFRLEKAYSMILEMEAPIKDVAQNVGYIDAKYFSRLFKKKYGVTPSQIRVKR